VRNGRVVHVHKVGCVGWLVTAVTTQQHTQVVHRIGGGYAVHVFVASVAPKYLRLEISHERFASRERVEQVFQHAVAVYQLRGAFHGGWYGAVKDEGRASIIMQTPALGKKKRKVDRSSTVSYIFFQYYFLFISLKSNQSQQKCQLVNMALVP
jgi:hypothetical protein